MRDYENIFALLLLCSLAILSGHKAAYERAESDRGVLMLACKRRRLLDCQHLLSKRSSTRIGESDITQAWHSWVQMEQFKRLGLSIWVGVPSQSFIDKLARSYIHLSITRDTALFHQHELTHRSFSTVSSRHCSTRSRT